MSTAFATVLLLGVLLLLAQGLCFHAPTGRAQTPNRSTLLMGFRSSVKGAFSGVRSSVGGLFRRSKRDRSDAELKTGIGKFYDETSAIWLDTWGEDMHHGYYPASSTPARTIEDHKSRQVDMIDRTVSWAYGASMPTPTNMVDVGCGVGGSSRHIAKKYGCTGKGLSLSPYQIERAKQFTQAAGLGDRLEYLVADAMSMPFPDASFDFVWSMESGEHMPDKAKFVGELARVAAPGGRIIIVTWCHRELAPGEQLTPKELRLLGRINDAYYLPAWVPGSAYVNIAKGLGLRDVRFADWSEFVAPFWPAVFRSALVPRNFLRMMRTGMTTIKGAIATLYMLQGFRRGLVKFVLITAQKPPL